MNRKLNNLVLVLLGILFVFGVWLLLFYKLNDWPFKLNEFGDFTGGTLGAIFSFITLILLIRQNEITQRREDNRDEKDEHRELSEFHKFELEMFLRRVELLENKIMNLQFKDKSGIGALESYAQVDVSLNTKDFYNDRSDRFKFEPAVSSVIKTLNALFFDVIQDLYTIQNGKNIPWYVKRSIKSKYEILITQFDERLFDYIWNVLIIFKTESVSFSFNENSNFIIALQRDYTSGGNFSKFPQVENPEGIKNLYTKSLNVKLSSEPFLL